MWREIQKSVSIKFNSMCHPLDCEAIQSPAESSLAQGSAYYTDKDSEVFKNACDGEKKPYFISVSRKKKSF